ncbi:MAG: hypothetical protein IJT16_10465 [Lachnospiraceae bacterium]|nr:hypothetical protein [Lachnospiraceae bacterium]
MNLTSFLKQINKISSEYTKEQLNDFIREIARIIPEYRRDEFLYKLQSLSEGTKKKTADVQRAADDKEEYEMIMKDLEMIGSGEICLEEILNEEYDDWYNDEEEEFFYKDDEDIVGKLEKACDYVHKCVDAESYTNGFDIGSRLFEITVGTTGEYDYNESLNIKDMVYHELLNRDVKKIVYDTLYCGYMSMGEDDDHIEDMYKVIHNSQIQDITVEGLMQHGDTELPDFDGFLNKWIEYLGKQKGRLAEDLFNESVRLMNDPHKACVLADRFMEEHPGVYFQIMNNPDGLATKEIVQIGYAAIRKIPTKYVVRSKTALKTAEYILKEKSRDLRMLEDCYFAAYESDTTPVNYLRALLNGFDCPEKRDRLNLITSKMSKGTDKSLLYDDYYRSDVYGEQSENKPGKYTLVMLNFLEGRFKYVMQYHMNAKEPLGWSSTFMKQGIAVFLLYLYEGEWDKIGIKAMTRKTSEAMHFSDDSYKAGLESDNSENGTLFLSVFRRWRSLTPMEDDYKQIVLDKIEGLIEKRTEGIMNANRRNYYGECASYIAALGEVRESLGEKGAKQRIMAEYKDRYTRRTAFRSELKTYGWRG